MSGSGTDFLSFSCKRTDRLDIKTPISKYVAKSFGRETADDIMQDVEEVVRRRTEVVAVSGGGPSEGAREILASYYRALSVMETRFPISRDPAHAQVAFYWMNAMNPRKKSKQTNIHFEKASVLFNIAAHLSQQASQQNKDSQAGYKEAMRCFQEAAGAFAQVRDVALKVENPKPADLMANFLMMTEKLMLAQGQECVYWIASRDQKSAFNLSRLAKQASILYAEVLGFLSNPAVREDLDRSWQDLVQSKSWLFEALCQHHAAQDAKSKEDISTEIARLNQATMLLQKLQKSGKFATSALPAMITELVSATTHRLQAAERDNASVYLKRVLPFNELPVINGAQLVKPADCPYLDASKEHIFSDLIPEPITKALSRYSELVDGVIRKMTDKLNGATDEARVKLKQHELPELLDSITTATAAVLSETVKKDLDEVEQCGGLASLEDMAKRLNEVKTTVRDDLIHLQTDLDEEAAQDSHLREHYGQKWTSSTSASQTAGIRKSIVSYLDNIKGTDNSDRVVQEKLTGQASKFATLSVSGCVEQLPKLETGMVNTSDLEPQTLVANLRSCLDQLTAMSEERAGLEESLKETKNKDNLLPKLVATGVGSHEELFKVELQKYDELEKDVDVNLNKQQELLKYMHEAVGTFHQTFDVPAWKQKVAKFCADIKTDITAFYDVRANLGEGMRFYLSLRTYADTLKQNTQDYILSRKIDREDRLELLKASEKPASAMPAQAPPQLPMEPQAYNPPPVPTEDTNFSAVPPPPPDISVAAQSYHGAPYGVEPMHSGSGISVDQASAPPTLPPDSGYHQPTGPPSRPPMSHDAMVESPNPYYPPPHEGQYYNHYAPAGQYAPQQQHVYQAGQGPPTGPPPPGYPMQGHAGHQPMQYAGAGDGTPPPPPSPPQYQQGGYYQQGQQTANPYPQPVYYQPGQHPSPQYTQPTYYQQGQPGHPPPPSPYPQVAYHQPGQQPGQYPNQQLGQGPPGQYQPPGYPRYG